MTLTAQPDRSICPSDEDLLVFVDGSGGPEWAALVAEHIDVCEHCFGVVAVCAGPLRTELTLTPRSPVIRAVFPIGFVVAGRYEVLAFIGRGGMGEVYQVLDRLLDQTVALKTIQVGEDDPMDFGRAKAEVRLARLVTHPHVCRIFDLGVHEDQRGKTTFLTMEFVQGETLARRLRSGPVSAEFVIQAARQISQALASAHDAGIVHRDVKPENVILRASSDTEVPQAVITDFGLARRLPRNRRSGSTHPSVRQTCGTPGYMAPEVWLGEPVTMAVDVYAFGMVLLEMLSACDDLKDMVVKEGATSGPSEARSYPRPNVASDLQLLCELCVRPDAANRPANFHVVMRALESITTDPVRQRRRTWAGILAVAVLVGLAMTGAAWKRDSKSAEVPMRMRRTGAGASVSGGNEVPPIEKASLPDLDSLSCAAPPNARQPFLPALIGNSARKMRPRYGANEDKSSHQSLTASKAVGRTVDRERQRPQPETEMGELGPDDAIDPFATAP